MIQTRSHTCRPCATLVLTTSASVLTLVARPAATQTTDTRVLERLQHQLADAMVRADTAFLARLLAPEFVYVDGAGRVQGPQATLDDLGTGIYRSLRYDSLRIHITDGTAAVTAHAPATFRNERGEWVAGSGRISRIHVRSGDAWPVVLYHVTRMPQVAPPAGPAPGDDERAIRAARAALNQALTERDTAVFARH